MEDLLPIRMTALHFLVGSYSVLNAIDRCPFSKTQIIDWVYAQQILNHDENEHSYHGFRGGPYAGFSCDEAYLESKTVKRMDIPSLPNTYTALCILKVCGDDLSRVNGKSIAKSLKYFQLEDGR